MCLLRDNTVQSELLQLFLNLKSMCGQKSEERENHQETKDVGNVIPDCKNFVNFHFGEQFHIQLQNTRHARSKGHVQYMQVLRDCKRLCFVHVIKNKRLFI